MNGDIPPQAFAYAMADFLAFSSVALSVIFGDGVVSCEQSREM